MCSQDMGEKTIVFIPGWATSRWSYRLTIRHWESLGYRVVVPEARFRKSHSLQDSLDQYVDEVFAYLKERDIARFTLIGFSLGGLVAMHYASRYEQEIEKLVLIDSAGIVPKRPFLIWSLWIARMWLLILLKDSVRLAFEIFLDYLKHVYTRPVHLWLSGRIGQNIGIDQLELPDRLETEVWWAEDDGVIPVRYGENLEKAVKARDLEVFPGRHMWICTDPEMSAGEL